MGTFGSFPYSGFVLIWLDVGKTVALEGSEQVELDLSLERLSADFVNVVSTIFPDSKAAPHLLVRVTSGSPANPLNTS